MAEWSEEQLRLAAELYGQANGEGRTPKEALGKVMSLAVREVAASGGTMTKEEIADRERASKLSAIDMEDVFEHITNQGAAVAELETQNATYGKAVDTLTRLQERSNAKIADMEGEYSELESDTGQLREALDDAKQLLQAIKHRGGDEEGIRRIIRADFDRSVTAGEGRQTYLSAGRAVARWVVEGDAVSEPAS
jgi:TolA-binding protein